MEEIPGQYVKLKKENITEQPANTEEGELNQPVEVPVVRCAAPSRDPERRRRILKGRDNTASRSKVTLEISI